jgi:ADP-heptose:LPS heptosyltransferase
MLLVHPGAGGAWKLWPGQSFAAVIRAVVSQTGCQVLVHRGPADLEAAEELARLLGQEIPLRLVEPELELLAGALLEADAYLGGDAGVSHLAAAVGAYAVIVFPVGSFERWAPWSTTAISLRADDEGAAEAAISAIARRMASRR